MVLIVDQQYRSTKCYSESFTMIPFLTQNAKNFSSESFAIYNITIYHWPPKCYEQKWYSLYKFTIQVLNVMQLYLPGTTCINTIYYIVKLARITIGDDCSVLCAAFTLYVHSHTTKLEAHKTQWYNTWISRMAPLCQVHCKWVTYYYQACRSHVV